MCRLAYVDGGEVGFGDVDLDPELRGFEHGDDDLSGDTRSPVRTLTVWTVRRLGRRAGLLSAARRVGRRVPWPHPSLRGLRRCLPCDSRAA